MANDTGYLELFGSLVLALYFKNARSTHQNFESSIETHLQVAIVVLVERSQETLLEDSRHERIRDDHETVGSVRE